MSISAIILSFNAKDDLEHCMTSLIDVVNLLPEHDQILIVDNGSTDGSKALMNRLASAFPDLAETIDLPTNHGNTISRKPAFARTRGDYILVIDSDIDFKRPVLQSLIGVMALNPSIGLIVSRLIFPSGKAQMSTDISPSVWRGIECSFRLRKLDQKTATSRQAHAVDYAISALWLMRRDLLQRFGFLDKPIFYAPEDVNFCLRTWRVGQQVYYQPNLDVVHDAKERSRSLKGLLFTWRHLVSLTYFFRKHGYFWSENASYRQIREARSDGMTMLANPYQADHEWAKG